jgi:hypothetical protein
MRRDAVTTKRRAPTDDRVGAVVFGEPAGGVDSGGIRQG